MDIPSFRDGHQDPIVNNPKSKAEINIEKLLSNPDNNNLAMLLYIKSIVESNIIRICEKLGLTRAELGHAAIEAGFNSANQTANAGLFQLGAGVILTGTGVAQGVSGCKSATELAQATEIRATKVADIEKNTMKEALPAEGADITVQVEALDDPVAPALDGVEETLSSKQTKTEEQIEAQKTVEKATAQGKMTEKKAEKLLEKANKEYEAAKNLIEAKKENFKTLGGIGQASYYMSQGLGDVEKHQSQKETIQKEIAEDSKSQIGNTADGLKREVDKMIDFNPARASSSSLKG